MSGQSQLLRDLRWVAFDTETTGLWAPGERLVELAGVAWRLGSDTYETFTALINPGRPIPAEVTAVHGITDAMVAAFPAADTALRNFFEFCGPDALLVAHHAPFDLSFLQFELRRFALSAPRLNLLDTVDLCRRHYPGEMSYSLLALARRFSLADSQEHRALADAFIVRGLVETLSDRLASLSRHDLPKMTTVYNLADWHYQPARLAAEYAPLQAALHTQQAVRILYNSPTAGSSERVIRPTLVFELNGSVYVTAYCELVKAERTFRLDRIASIEIVA